MDRITKCTQPNFIEICTLTCGFCTLPPSPPPPPSLPFPVCECQDTWTWTSTNVSVDVGKCATTQQGCPATACNRPDTEP
eukprot:scaffold87020_cov41-Phaeocystis_antarctica.AAC.1